MIETICLLANSGNGFGKLVVLRVSVSRRGERNELHLPALPFVVVFFLQVQQEKRTNRHPMARVIHQLIPQLQKTDTVIVQQLVDGHTCASKRLVLSVWSDDHAEAGTVGTLTEVPVQRLGHCREMRTECRMYSLMKNRKMNRRKFVSKSTVWFFFLVLNGSS